MMINLNPLHNSFYIRKNYFHFLSFSFIRRTYMIYWTYGLNPFPKSVTVIKILIRFYQIEFGFFFWKIVYYRWIIIVRICIYQLLSLWSLIIIWLQKPKSWWFIYDLILILSVFSKSTLSSFETFLLFFKLLLFLIIIIQVFIV